MSERGAGVWRLRGLTGYTPYGKPVQRSKTVKVAEPTLLRRLNK
jgi:hypothetical protein